MRIHNINVLGAVNTRRSFLTPLFEPLVKRNDLTVATALAGLQDAVSRLNRYEIYEPIDEVTLAPTATSNAKTSATDVDVTLALRERSRVYLRTGTELGNSEGGATAEAMVRNMFGGGESLQIAASAGTRTHSAYMAELSTPVRPADPDTRLALHANAMSQARPWARHEETSTLLGARLILRPGHTIAWASNFRTLTALAGNASPTLRRDAGPSTKNSIVYSYTQDHRDNAMMMQSGWFYKSVWEMAGWGGLGGDVSFSKSEVELSGAVPVPGLDGSRTGISFGGTFKAGWLWPLPFGMVMSGPAKPSHVSDRFHIGGPNDVRGFKQGRLGPRDGPDSVGGDIYSAGGVHMLLPLPRLGPDSSFRLQLFANAGTMATIRPPQRKTFEDGDDELVMSSSDVQKGLWKGASDIFTSGLPSTAVGIGLVYAHPVARFELNFCLPLVLKRGEEASKGFQVGVGINFM